MALTLFMESYYQIAAESMLERTSTGEVGAGLATPGSDPRLHRDHGDDERDEWVRELEAVTGMGQSLVSYHLQELRKADLVTASPVGRSNRYRLAHVDLDQLATLIGTLAPKGARV